MIAFGKCPLCGGELVTEQVEKLLRGGDHTAVLTVQAEVCRHCGDRLYDEQTIRRFEDIREKLKRQETDQFQPMGQSFRVE